MTGVYLITNIVNGRLYVGQSVKIERRFMEHKTPKGEANNPKHRADIAEYGIENFKFEVLEECDKSLLNEKELFYIRKLKPFYNTIGMPMDEKTKEKLRAAGKKQWEEIDANGKQKRVTENLKGPRKGHSVSQETREKLRRANIGKKYYHPVLIVETGQMFQSPAECAEYLDISTESVRKNIRGQTKTARGYHIKYAKCRD